MDAFSRWVEEEVAPEPPDGRGYSKIGGGEPSTVGEADAYALKCVLASMSTPELERILQELPPTVSEYLRNHYWQLVG